MKYYNRLKLLVLFLSIGFLAGCIDSGIDDNSSNASSDYSKSQIALYARSLGQSALLSQDMIGVIDWADSTLADSDFINVAMYDNNNVESGYCIHDLILRERVSFITWFNTEDADGNFVAKGLGTGSTGALIAALLKTISPDLLGIYRDGQIHNVSTNTAVDLPVTCALFIPDGSPIINISMNLPKAYTGVSVSYDYRADACSTGQTGHRLMIAEVSHNSDGSETVGAWTLQSDHCENALDIAVIETVSSSREGVDSAAIIAMDNGGSMSTLINDSLADIGCREARLIAAEDADEYLSKESSSMRQASFHNNIVEDDIILNQFDTCSDSIDIDVLENVNEVFIAIDHIEDATQSCGGEAGSYELLFSGYDAIVVHPIWSGDISFSREIYNYSMEGAIQVSEDDELRRDMRGDWYGVSIECHRPEVLNVACNDAQPDNASFSLTDSRGYNYNRENSIIGWADPVTLTPNTQENTIWSFDDVSSGCQWRQTRVIPEDCPANHTGSKSTTEESFFIAATLGSGSWSEWTVHSTTDTCQEDRDEREMYNDENDNGRKDAGEHGGWNDTSADDKWN